MAPGIWQILLIVLVILLLFGAGKLPRIMGDLAQGVKAFKKGLKDEGTETSDTPAVENKPEKDD